MVSLRCWTQLIGSRALSGSISRSQAASPIMNGYLDVRTAISSLFACSSFTPDISTAFKQWGASKCQSS